MPLASTQTGSIDWQCSPFDALTPAVLYRLLKLRQDIFVVEQDCVYQDLDDLDQAALHLMAWREGELLAYLRCLPPGLGYAESALGRIAVSKTARGLQLGKALVRRGIDINLQHWPGSGIRIGAQAYLERFYRELGFAADGDVYLEDGIPHVKMVYRDTV